jgi:hypothetical protein
VRALAAVIRQTLKEGDKELVHCLGELAEFDCVIAPLHLPQLALGEFQGDG